MIKEKIISELYYKSDMLFIKGEKNNLFTLKPRTFDLHMLSEMDIICSLN